MNKHKTLYGIDNNRNKIGVKISYNKYDVSASINSIYIYSWKRDKNKICSRIINRFSVGIRIEKRGNK